MNKSDVYEIKAILWLIVFMIVALDGAPIVITIFPFILTIGYSIASFMTDRKENKEGDNK